MATAISIKNWKLRLARIPREDAYSIDETNKIIAAADGVTRDPMRYLADKKTLRGQIELAWYYPRPSPSAIVSKLFCQTFPEFLRQYKPENRNEDAVAKSIAESNKLTHAWHRTNIPSPDYLTNDFAGCVAAVTSTYQDAVTLGFLTDAGVAIFHENGELKFRTENEGPDKFHDKIWEDPRLKNLVWEDPRARAIIRCDYRNNPTEPNSFGVLTGENSAMHYVRTATQEIKPGEILVVYTDGLEKVIFSDEFAAALRTKSFLDINDLARTRVKTEGTLVYSVHAPQIEQAKTAGETDKLMQLTIEQLARGEELIN